MMKIVVVSLACLLAGSALAQTQSPLLLTRPYSAIAPASPTGVLIKAGPGKLFHVACGSTQALPAVVKFYDSAVAPTCGSGTPFFRLVCPGATTGGNGMANAPNGKQFASGLGYCVSGGLADGDVSVLSANSVSVSMDYQ